MAPGATLWAPKVPGGPGVNYAADLIRIFQTDTLCRTNKQLILYSMFLFLPCHAYQ